MVTWVSLAAIIFSVLLFGSAPWLTAVSYTTVSIMQPQYIWFWSFQDFPIFRVTAGIAILAWLIQAVRGRILWRVYREGLVVALVALWVIVQLSQLFAPFDDRYAAVSASLVIGTLNTIVIMFLVVIGLIAEEKALKPFAIALIVIAIYYIWWCNAAYLGNEWYKFTLGRLDGPAGSPYADGNVFSILFVICMPFMLFGIFHFRSTAVRVGLILSLPLLWHALILCASRGALLSSGIGTLLAALMIRSRALNLTLVAGFVAFLAWQGGPLLERAMDTLETASVEQDKPINPRIVSWQVGADLVRRYPILGVGPQRFRTASLLLYPGRTPHVAHNTLLNFGANTGVFAALIYLYFFWAAYRIYREDSALAEVDSTHLYINRSCACALAGFFVGALFLDLIIFEPFYLVLLLMCANHFLLKQKRDTAGELPTTDVAVRTRPA